MECSLLTSTKRVHVFNGHNFSSDGPGNNVNYESLERGLSDDVLKSKVYFGPVLNYGLWI